jgi:hypothetical protein
VERPGVWAMFVHDFVIVDRPAPDVVAGLTSIAESTLAALVVAAWTEDRETWAQLGRVVPPRHDLVGPLVHLGLPVHERGASILTLSWVGESALTSCPDLQGNLEVATKPDDTTHLHLLGDYVLKDVDDAWTAATGPLHRATSVAMRRFLTMLGEVLESGCSLEIRTPSAHHR